MTSAREACLVSLLQFGNSGTLRDHPNFEDVREFRRYTLLIKGIFRFRPFLDRTLLGFVHRTEQDLDPLIVEILRISAFELIFLRTPPYAVVSEAVALIKRKYPKATGFVNAILRNLARENLPLPNSFSLEDLMPTTLAKMWSQILTRERLSSVTRALSKEPILSIRTNRWLTTPQNLLEQLRQERVEVEASPLLPDSLRIQATPPLATLNSFKQGLFYVQNEAAQLPVLLLDPKPGEDILDICACPGGKTTQILELTRGKSRVVAVDKNVKGLQRLVENQMRLHLPPLELREGDFRKMSFSDTFSRVLLDAPCSGWGVLRDHPEWRWTKEAQNLRYLASVQGELFDKALELTKPGGVLVYSVCTFSLEETVQLLDQKLSAHPCLTLEDPRPYLPEKVGVFATTRFVQTFPGDDELSGFFIARLRRKE